jgi:hypothetical protein
MIHIVQIAALLPLAEGQNQPAADWWARTIAGLGLFLVIVNFIWDIIKFNRLAREREQDRAERLREKQEQEERNEERVEIEVGYEDEGVTPNGKILTAKLFNHRDFTIPITKVELRYGERPDGSCAIPLVTTVGAEMATTSPDVGSVRVSLGSSNSIELGPRTSAVFYLPAKHRNTLRGIKGRPEQVWIAAHSYAGEIGRVSGEAVLTFIQVMVNSVPV